MSVTDHLKRQRAKRTAPKNVTGNGRKKVVSGHGDGIWQSNDTLARYRVKRNKARKLAKAHRRSGR